MNWVRNFMRDRNGVDQLSTFMVIGSLFIRLIFVTWLKLDIMGIISSLTSIFALYRIFSKNKRKRYKENMQFLNFISRIKLFFKKKLARIKGLKNYKYFNCPSCNQSLRVPRGKGKLSIRCPKCNNRIIRRT